MRSLLRRVARGMAWVVVVLVTSAATWALAAEQWSDRWGATPAELDAALPGDELIEAPKMVTTRAGHVGVPPDAVWPWVAQFGQGRGGLYSYDWLERMVGIDMVSADRVLPSEQDIEVGQQIWVTQPGYPADLGMVVAAVDPGRALVLSASTPNRPTQPEQSPWTWAFVLRPEPNGSTRLIVRNHNASVGGIGDVIWDRVVGPIGFAMERRTMLGIAERAERAAGVSTGSHWREPLWFAALVVTGLALLVIMASRTPWRRKAAYVVGLTAGATVVLFRLPSAALAVALAAFSVLAAVLLWRAWRSAPTAQPPRPVVPAEEPSHPLAGVRS